MLSRFSKQFPGVMRIWDRWQHLNELQPNQSRQTSGAGRLRADIADSHHRHKPTAHTPRDNRQKRQFNTTAATASPPTNPTHKPEGPSGPKTPRPKLRPMPITQ